MSLESLQERLTALQETTTQLRELIDRLAHLEFQPGSVPQGTDEESSVSGELSAEVGLLLRSGLEDQELLLEEVKFARPEGADKTRLRDSIQRLGTELVSCRGAFRKARLAARASLIQAQKLERQLLIQSYSRPVSEPDDTQAEGEETTGPVHRPQRYYQQQQYSSLSEEDQRTVGASSNVTNALRRTHDLIAAELFRSEYAHETLTISSEALKNLNESYSSLDSMLANSRNLLGTLVRSQKSDTWYLQTAMYMLMVTGAWLLYRRLLYGPLWWFVWLPLRILFGVGSKAGSAVMHRGAGGSGNAGGVGENGKVSVEGLPKEDLPTAQVGQKTRVSEGDADSMIDKVARMVEEADVSGNLGKDGIVDSEHQPGNPKKRMWVEPDTEEVVEDMHRDEL